MDMPPPPQGGIDLSALKMPKLFPFHVKLDRPDGSHSFITLMGDGSIQGDIEGVQAFISGFRTGADPMYAVTMHTVLWQMRVQGLLVQMAELLAQAKEEGVHVQATPEAAGSV